MDKREQSPDKLLDAIKHPLDPERFHRLFTKTQWFVLFNVVAIAGLFFTRRLVWSLESVITTVIALLAVNLLATISAQNFPDWK